MSVHYEVQVFRGASGPDDVALRAGPDREYRYDALAALAFAFGTGTFMAEPDAAFIQISAVRDGNRRPLTADEQAVLAEHGDVLQPVVPGDKLVVLQGEAWKLALDPRGGAEVEGDFSLRGAAETLWRLLMETDPVFDQADITLTYQGEDRVRLWPGRVEFVGGYEPDVAARMFWDAVVATFPEHGDGGGL